jgi:hypothetical protein
MLTCGCCLIGWIRFTFFKIKFWPKDKYRYWYWKKIFTHTKMMLRIGFCLRLSDLENPNLWYWRQEWNTGTAYSYRYLAFCELGRKIDKFVSSILLQIKKIDTPVHYVGTALFEINVFFLTITNLIPMFWIRIDFMLIRIQLRTWMRVHVDLDPGTVIPVR